MRIKPLVMKVRSALPASSGLAENGGGAGSLLSQAIGVGVHKQGMSGKAERKFAPY